MSITPVTGTSRHVVTPRLHAAGASYNVAARQCRHAAFVTMPRYVTPPLRHAARCRARHATRRRHCAPRHVTLTACHQRRRRQRPTTGVTAGHAQGCRCPRLSHTTRQAVNGHNTTVAVAVTASPRRPGCAVRRQGCQRRLVGTVVTSNNNTHATTNNATPQRPHVTRRCRQCRQSRQQHGTAIPPTTHAALSSPGRRSSTMVARITRIWRWRMMVWENKRDREGDESNVHAAQPPPPCHHPTNFPPILSIRITSSNQPTTTTTTTQQQQRMPCRRTTGRIIYAKYTLNHDGTINMNNITRSQEP